MTPKAARPTTVAEYIAAAPPVSRKKLREMRACIRAAAPGAEEGLKWGMPSFSYKRILVIYGAFKHHIGFYPTSSATKAFAKQLSKYQFAKGSIQFPLAAPLPLSLIRRIAAFRVKESLAEDKKWRTPKRGRPAPGPEGKNR
jgi:uncharacterized protein YdhG (YjbR/CyaY superfamily)